MISDYSRDDADDAFSSCRLLLLFSRYAADVLRLLLRVSPVAIYAYAALPAAAFADVCAEFARRCCRALLKIRYAA